VLAVAAMLALPGSASAGLVLRPVQHAGQVKGTNVFIGIVEKPGNRFRAYVSDGRPTSATLSVWFRGDIADDGSLSATDHRVTLAARIADDRARGTVTLPDGRVLRFAMRERRGGLVERNFVHEGVRYRSGWIVLEDNRVRARLMIAGEALDGSVATGPGVRPNPSCEQLKEDYQVLRVQQGKLLHQSGRWELRLNRGRGSAAAYNRLNQVIGAVDETIFTIEPGGGPYAACDSPSAGSLSSARPVSARNSNSTSLKAVGRSAIGM
jgi:hypothetical protein